MTREEYMNIVGKYQDFLCYAERMDLVLGRGICELEDTPDLSEDETEYLAWLQEVSEGLGHILS